MADPSSTVSSALIGEIFVERGHITPAQLEEALATQAETGELLGEILVSRYNVPRVELAGVLAEQWATMERSGDGVAANEPIAEAAAAFAESSLPATVDVTSDVDFERRPIGEIFVEQGVVSQSQLEAALTTQAESGQRLGEVLVAQGVITRLELASALADQWSTLQKIRPPEPRSAEPWQEAAVRATPPGEAPISSAPNRETSAEVEGLRDAVKALEERLRLVSATSSAATGPAPDEALRELGATFERQLEELAQGLDERFTADLASVREALDELRAKVSEPGDDDRVAALEQRLETAVDGLLARIESTAGNGTDEAIEGLRATLAGLEHRSAEAPTREDLDALRVAFGAVSDDVRRLTDIPAGVTHDELEQHLARVAGKLGARIDELAGATGDDPAVAEVRAQVSALADQIANLPGSAEPSDLSDRVNGLAARVDEIGQSFANGADLETLRGEIDAERESRSAIAGRLDETDERLTAIDELRARIDALGDAPARVDATIGELDNRLTLVSGTVAALPTPERVAALEESLAALPTSERVAALEESLASVPGPDRVAAVEAAVAELAELRSGIDALAAAPTSVSDDQMAALAARLDELSSRLDASASAERVDELAHSLETIRSVEDGQIDSLRTSVRELSEGLRELAGRGQGVTADELEQAVAVLRSRLDELGQSTGVDEVARQGVDELRVQLDGIGTRIGEAAGHELGELKSRVEQLAVAIGDDRLELEVATLRSQLDPLAARVEELAADAHEDQLSPQLVELRDQLKQLASRVEDSELPTVDSQALSDRVESLATDYGARLHSLEDIGNRVQELDRQLAELPVPSGDTTDELESLRSRIDELAATAGGVEAARQGVVELRERLDALGELAASLDQQQTVGSAAVEDVGGRLADLVSRFETVAQSDWVAGIERTASDTATALQHRLQALEERTSGEAASAQELAEARAMLEALGARVTQLSQSLDETQGNVVAIDGNVAATLEAAVKDMVSASAVAELAGQVHARLAAIEATAAPTRAALDELGMRLGATEQNAWALPEELDGRFARLHQELSARIEALGSGQGAALAAVNARLDEIVGVDEARLVSLEQAAGYASARLDGVEARLAETGGPVAERVDALEERFAAEAKRAEARGKETEKAIRKGLAALAERLGANEEAYLESGKALRRAIERLGAAVIEADTRIAGMPLDAPEDGYVAFVPTGDGYRLRPLEGKAPAVGEVIDLGEELGQLRVSRIATSPLPLDRRACAYLERA